jgi:hypothetical protein
VRPRDRGAGSAGQLAALLSMLFAFSISSLSTRELRARSLALYGNSRVSTSEFETSSPGCSGALQKGESHARPIITRIYKGPLTQPVYLTYTQTKATCEHSATATNLTHQQAKQRIDTHKAAAMAREGPAIGIDLGTTYS